MGAAQQLISKKQVDLDLVLSLPDVKRVPFLSILTRTGFED
jgi:hypothetical protein